MNPLLLDFPDQIETERLLIRAPRIGDGAHYNRAVLESFEELRPWFPWAQARPSLEESDAMVLRAVEKWQARTDLQMVIFDKSGEMVGSSGLQYINWNVPKFEIGYWVRTGFGGRGLMTEAVRAIADFAFAELGAMRVEIQCDSLNYKSAALARSAGFGYEITFRNYARRGDTLYDMMIWSRVREETAR